MSTSSTRRLGPLASGSTVVIVGGGPGGSACAIALKNLAKEEGRQIRVILYEGKIFESSTHYNQCAGVLSPPIVDILQEGLGVPFPWDLVQREITGYVLHSDHADIALQKEEDPTCAVRRINFDDFLLKQAKEKGVEVVHSRVTDIELNNNGLIVYSESSNSRADVIVGAFGMDDGMAKIFERLTPYRQPLFMSSIVTKVEPGPESMARFGSWIHAFLPPIDKIEFGAATPKMNHITINIAGLEISAKSMDRFLRYPPVRKILPPQFDPDGSEFLYFKGRFPLRVSRGFYGDRYVMVGDAAGLLRPFKGKGVNMSMVSAIRAAKTMVRTGISREAFEAGYVRGECKEVLDDLPYGRALRWLAIRGSRWQLLDPVIEMAKENELLEEALFNCVSAHKAFKQIFRETMSARLVLRSLKTLGLYCARKIGRRQAAVATSGIQSQSNQ